MSSRKAKYPVDLHCHTTRSDGADSPKELIDNAVERRMNVIAITDHDIRPPMTIQTPELGTVDIIEYAKNKGLKIIPGIEISCDTLVDDVHIVCLGCNWNHPYFDFLEKAIVESKLDGYQKLVRILNEAGYCISWDEVLDNNGSPIDEQQVQKKMIFELLANKGYFNSWSDAKLMIKNDKRFAIPREKPDPISVIKYVHEAGGIAILAHPFLITPSYHVDDVQKFRDMYIDKLLQAGLDSMESSYPYEKTSYNGEMTSDEIEKYIIQKYKNRVSFFSGGSDYHADVKKGAKNPREIGECGLSDHYYLEKTMLHSL